MSRGTLILGGGFGGLATAHALRDRLGPNHPITLIDRRTHFYVGLRKLWVLVGATSIEEGSRPLAALETKGIRFVRTSIRHIDPERRVVETDAETFEGDQLVVALGAEPRPELVPGMAEYTFNLYDPTSVTAAGRVISTIDHGRVLVIIAGLPYKCPPAPYEAAFMLDAHLRSRGVRSSVEMVFSTLQQGLLPNAGPDGAHWIGTQLSERGIRWQVDRHPLRFEGDEVVFGDAEGEETSREAFDVAVVTPPHRAPPVVSESTLGDRNGWISVNRGTLETPFQDVYAIGDCTHIPLAGNAALPKAGLMAESEALRVAGAIASRLLGREEPPPFDGRGQCFLEMGGEEAALIEGDFYREPAPSVRIADVSHEHYLEKVRFEQERLDRWLG